MVVAALGVVASVAALVYATVAPPGEARLNDFYREAWPAYAALAHGDVPGFLRLGPGYIGSLVLRAPFALIPTAWAGPRAVYFASALPCLLAAVALCLWLAAQPRRNGGIGWASRLIPIFLCILNPIVLVALFGGHPEDVLGAALCVGAVVLASDGHPRGAWVLATIAVVNKPWALVVVPVVLAVRPPQSPRALLILVASACAAIAAALAVAGGVVSAAIGIGTIFNPPQLLWWLGPHSWVAREARVEIVAAAALCSALFVGVRRASARDRTDTPDALALLTLVLLLRAALDPWNNLYYHVPFLFALIAYEIRSGRMPLMTAIYSVALLTVVPVSGFPPMSADLRAGLYAAIVAVTFGWLARRLYACPGRRASFARVGSRRAHRRDLDLRLGETR